MATGPGPADVTVNRHEVVALCLAALDGAGAARRVALTGALLPFCGYKGANIALLVELLSSMAGGNRSIDAPPWDSGPRSPSVGMFVLAVDHRTRTAAPRVIVVGVTGRSS